jgi:hypothetical protein
MNDSEKLDTELRIGFKWFRMGYDRLCEHGTEF